MTTAARTDRWRAFARDDVAPAVVPWLVARVLVVASLALANYLFDEIGRGPRPTALRLGLLTRDAAFYRDIAEHGYDAVGRSGLRFFPLLPLTARPIGALLGGRTDIALLVVANVAALAFGALLHRLVMRETGDAALARRAVWFGALLPPAIVLVLGYAESLLLVLAVGIFLLLRTQRWEWAAVLGVLAGLCRPTGILLALPAAIEGARGWRAAGGGARVRRVLPVVGPIAGTGCFLAWVEAVRGDGLLPFRVQQDPTLRGGFTDPVTSLAAAAGDLGSDRIGSGLHLFWAALFVVLIVALARRMPSSYTVYALGAVLLALSADNLDSFERYGVATFPIVIGAALVTARREVETAALTLAGGALVGYGTLVFLGRYVP
ncbi:MAG: hypothetical protein FJW88_06095 [Actinobacteria bacterium]|nr:hypothetical protein [Actinomycetota bacterium]